MYKFFSTNATLKLLNLIAVIGYKTAVSRILPGDHITPSPLYLTKIENKRVEIIFVISDAYFRFREVLVANK